MDSDELQAMVEELIRIGETMLPVVEFCEGERAKLIKRGWSEDAAAQYAVTLLVGLTEKALHG
jgi:hypothetical protein